MPRPRQSPRRAWLFPATAVPQPGLRTGRASEIAELGTARLEAVRLERSELLRTLKPLAVQPERGLEARAARRASQVFHLNLRMYHGS